VLKNHGLKSLLGQTVRWEVVEITAAALKPVLLRELFSLGVGPMGNRYAFNHALFIFLDLARVVCEERRCVESFKRFLADRSLGLFKMDLVLPKTRLG
jgi:hypothetical protein